MQSKSTNPSTLKDQLHEDIKRGDLKKALDYLLKMTKDSPNLHQQIILLHTAFNGINEGFIKGMLSLEDKNQAMEELGQRTLILVNNLSDKAFHSDFLLLIKANLGISVGLLVGVLLLGFWLVTKLKAARQMDTAPIVLAMKEKLQSSKNAMCVELRFQKNGSDKIFSDAKKEYELWKNQYASFIKNAEQLKELDYIFLDLEQIKIHKKCVD
jgi:Effector-associated domain 11